MITEIILFIICLATLLFAVKFLQAINKSKKLPKAPTYSKSVDSSLVDSGIFVKHGVVGSKNEVEVLPQSKKSDTYCDTLF